MADPTTAYSTVEFVLRQRSIPDALTNVLFLALCPSSSDSGPAPPSLRRAILLRRLSSDLSSRCFTPRSLRLIELLQSLDPRPNPLASEAYLSVATYLVTSAPDFDSSVSSILNHIGAIMRSPNASGLVSDRMKGVAEEMEKALTDSVLREEVVSRNALKEAMESVEVFLEMEWQPCFLENLAQPTTQGKPTSIPKTIPSPVVKKQVEDLRSSCAELLKMVVDPLPEAIKFANEVAESLRGKVGEDIQVDMDVAAKLGGEGTSTGLPKRSLMDHNPTASHYEWSESTELTSHHSKGNTRRFQLATPKISPVSPLRKVKNRKVGTRRKVKRWSVLEEDTLRKAIEDYGRGNWKKILYHYRYIFDERTEADLKDKWRNMTRS